VLYKFSLQIVLALWAVFTLTGQTQLSFIEERILLQGSNFAENYEVRQAMHDMITATNFSQLNATTRVMAQEGYNNRVRLSVIRTDEHFYIMFANEILYTEEIRYQAARRREAEAGSDYDLLLADRFRTDGRGNYIFKKSLTDGSLIQLKIYLQSGIESYLLIQPQGDSHISVDVFMFGAPVYRNIRVGMNFITVATSSLARLMAATTRVIDWSLLLPLLEFSSDWNRLVAMVDQIRLRLPQLTYASDGVQNAQGEMVFLSSGEPQLTTNGFGANGFTKWIMDGLFAPLNEGKLIDLAPLTTAPEVNDRRYNPWMEAFFDREPFLGLDWNRNLAFLVNRAMLPRRRIKLHDSDVSINPFVAYIDDVGFPLNKLKTVLFVEAIRNPGALYLGSVNLVQKTHPALRLHLHTVVLLPYFTKNGEFRIAQFDNGSESTPEDLERRYPGGFIHLQRVITNGAFKLPAVPRVVASAMVFE
jgi:hypothetical protein